MPIQIELTDRLMDQIQREILEGIDKTGVKGLVIDVSGVRVLDHFLAQKVSDTARMASLLGTTTVIVGFRPEVAAALVDLDFELKDVETALTFEGAYRKLEPVLLGQEQEEEVEEEVEEQVEEDGQDDERPDAG